MRIKTIKTLFFTLLMCLISVGLGRKKPKRSFITIILKKCLISQGQEKQMGMNIIQMSHWQILLVLKLLEEERLAEIRDLCLHNFQLVMQVLLILILNLK